MNQSAKDPSAVVVPFGKHRGRTVAELLTHDPAYAEWLLAQGWLAERFAELHAAILTRGAATDDSPEHNTIQARFLDPLFRAACVLAVESVAVLTRYRDKYWDELAIDASWRSGHRLLDRYIHQLSDDERAERRRLLDAAKQQIPLPTFGTLVEFEVRGVDVRIQWGFNEVKQYYTEGSRRPTLKVEIKPSLGEDYPTVMRQMARLGANCLLVETYTGRAVPFETVRQMFGANGLVVVTLRDVEAEIANARGWVADKPPNPL